MKFDPYKVNQQRFLKLGLSLHQGPSQRLKLEEAEPKVEKQILLIRYDSALPVVGLTKRLWSAVKSNIPRVLEVKNRQVGFSQIELVMVITFLGLLATIILPKATDLTDSAGDSSLKAIGNSVTVGSMNNRIATQAKHPGAYNVTEADVCTPSSLSRFLQGSLPTGYTVSRLPENVSYGCNAVGQTVPAVCNIRHTASAKVISVPLYCAGDVYVPEKNPPTNPGGPGDDQV